MLLKSLNDFQVYKKDDLLSHSTDYNSILNRTNDTKLPNLQRKNTKTTAPVAEPGYIWETLEENLINYFIEKVVVMREVPLMKATYILECENNMRKIQEKLSKLGPLSGFASKQANKKMLEAQKMRGKLKTTKPYEGGLG